MTLINSSTLTLNPQVDPQVTDHDGDDDDLTHIYCEHCTPEPTVALCGKNLTHDEFLGDYEGPEPDTCIVCAELFETHDCT